MTLNQQYRESGSHLPFKEWLFEQQLAGAIDEPVLNATGDAKKEKPRVTLFGIPGYVWLIGSAILITTGIIIYKKRQ